jgi:hypothetical protein
MTRDSRVDARSRDAAAGYAGHVGVVVVDAVNEEVVVALAPAGRT